MNPWHGNALLNTIFETIDKPTRHKPFKFEIFAAVPKADIRIDKHQGAGYALVLCGVANGILNKLKVFNSIGFDLFEKTACVFCHGFYFSPDAREAGVVRNRHLGIRKTDPQRFEDELCSIEQRTVYAERQNMNVYIFSHKATVLERR
jgi:hypothetical protein